MNATAVPQWLLVIENDLDQWVLLKTHLKRILPQVEALHALDQFAAFRYLRARSKKRNSLPSLILQDLYLPQKVDGLKLLIDLKHPISPYRHIPIMMMSMSKDPIDVGDAYQVGVNTFLFKPLSSNEWTNFLEGVQYFWQVSASSSKIL